LFVQCEKNDLFVHITQEEKEEEEVLEELFVEIKCHPSSFSCSLFEFC